MANHFVYFDKKSLLNHDVEYKNVKSFLSSNFENTFVDWECLNHELKGDPKSTDIHTYIVPYEILIDEKFVISDFIKNSISNGKTHIVYFNKKDQKVSPRVPCLGIPTDRGTFVLESLLGYVSNFNSVGPLSLLEHGLDVLHVKKIPEPSDLLSYFSVIFFGLKKINPLALQYRNKIKSIFNNLSEEVFLYNLQKHDNFSLKVGFSNNLLVVSLRWEAKEEGLFSFFEKNLNWARISPQVSSCWINFFSDNNCFEFTLLSSLAFDSQKSLPPENNARPLGLYVIENESRKLQDVKITQDEHVDRFEVLKIPLIFSSYAIPEPKVKTDTSPNEVNHVWVAKKSIMGHGLNFKELVYQMDVKSSSIVKPWIIDKDKWVDDILKKDPNTINTFIVPHYWPLLLGQDVPDELLKRILSGNVRLFHFSKKGELPILNVPTMSIPSDRGSLLMEALISICGQSHYSGIQALFPLGANILTRETSFQSDDIGKGFDKVFSQIKEIEGKKINDFSVKINFSSKNIIRLIFEEQQGVQEEKAILRMGVHNNLMAFSINFPSLKNPFSWIFNNEKWKPIYSSTSSSWFNYFPEQERMEVTYVLSFSIDYEKTFTEIKNSNPLGIEIFSNKRIIGNDQEEKGIDKEGNEVSVLLEKSNNEELNNHKKNKGYSFESEGTKIERDTYTFEVAEKNKGKLLKNIEHNPHVLCISLYLYHKLMGQMVFDELMEQEDETQLRLYSKLPELKEKYNVNTWKEVYLKLNSKHKKKEDFYLEKVKGEFDLISLVSDRLGTSISHFYKRMNFYGKDPDELFNFSPHISDLFSFSVRVGFRECIKYFIEWNLVPEKFIMRSIDVAIKRNKFDSVKVIVKSIDYIDWLENKSLIYWVIDMGFIELMDTIIEKGININRNKKGDEAPLCYAAKKSNLEMVKLLVENGADINQAKGLPLEYCVENRDLPLLKYFLETKLVREDVIDRCLVIAQKGHEDRNIIELLSNFNTEKAK